VMLFFIFSKGTFSDEKNPKFLSGFLKYLS